MEHNNKSTQKEAKIETARCPQCNALCLNGHDEDNQIYCANCGKSFKPQSYISLSLEEFKAMSMKATECHTKSGWIAFEVGELN